MNTIPTWIDWPLPIFVWGEPKLPDDWGNLILHNNSGDEIDFVSYSNKFDWPVLANGAGYTLELRNPTEENMVTKHWKTSDFLGGSPGNANRPIFNQLLFINEFQADNKSTIKDENGEYDDWIELYNAHNYPINLNGIYITDDYSDLTKHQLLNSDGEPFYLEPDDHILLWADGISEQGMTHLNFRLNTSGEEIALVYVFDSNNNYY